MIRLTKTGRLVINQASVEDRLGRDGEEDRRCLSVEIQLLRERALEDLEVEAGCVDRLAASDPIFNCRVGRPRDEAAEFGAVQVMAPPAVLAAQSVAPSASGSWKPMLLGVAPAGSGIRSDFTRGSKS